MLYQKRRIFLVGALVLSAGLSEAQVHRTFVSVNGNDGNDCLTPASACRTINAAVTKVDADGEVIIASTGSYAGAAITKSVRVNAPSGIVAFAALPITINAPAANVVIRGFTIKAVTPGAGTGIAVTAVGTLLLENMVVDGWATGVSTPAGKISVADSTFRNNTSFGFLAGSAGSVSVVRSQFENNFNGFVTAGGAVGSVSRSSATGNSNVGFAASGAGSVLAVDRCQASGNGKGVNAETGGLLRLANSSVSGNTIGVQNVGSTIESFGTSGIRGNTTNISGALTAVVLQ
jgi:hypothetical protein